MIIKLLKQKQGLLNDTEFASKLGVHRCYWNQLKNRNVPLNLKILAKVKKAFPDLGPDIDIFFTSNFTDVKQPVTPHQALPQPISVALRAFQVVSNTFHIRRSNHGNTTTS